MEEIAAAALDGLLENSDWKETGLWEGEELAIGGTRVSCRNGIKSRNQDKC